MKVTVFSWWSNVCIIKLYKYSLQGKFELQMFISLLHTKFIANIMLQQSKKITKRTNYKNYNKLNPLSVE